MSIGTEKTNGAQGQLSLSHLADVVSVLNHVVECMQRHAYLHRDVFGVELALEEALHNALCHGNGLDASKSVRVTYHVNAKQVWLEVQDEGNGFSPNDVRDPTLAEHLGEPGGRGLLFIRTFMSSVEYNETGNRVRMVKRRSA